MNIFPNLEKAFREKRTTYPKIAVIGHARHGKDTVCEMLRDHWGFSFTSSSQFCSEKIVFPAYQSYANGIGGKYSDIVRKHMSPLLPVWRTPSECFEARSSWRSMWFDLISAYNSPDAAQLAKAILRDHDIYAGIRSTREYMAARNEGVFDISIWVDRSAHLPKESSSSMQLEPWMADFYIDNNGDLNDLHFELTRFVSTRLEV